MRFRWAAVVLVLVLTVPRLEACGPGRGGFKKILIKPLTALVFKQHIPNEVENSLAASGPSEGAIDRDDSRFKDFVLNYNQDIIFKDEEGTAADRVMTQRCQEKLNTLAISVMNQWPGIRLRVTEAWDEEKHHSSNSLHYEGRAVDITTSDRDRGKYGMLARLAKEAGFDWVYYESRNHIHCSVKSEPTHSKYGGCFSSESTVKTSSGETKQLKDLEIGENILTYDLETGETVFSEVLLFLDRNPGEVRRFVHVETTRRTLKVTASHLVVIKDANNITRTIFAAELKVGDTVLVLKDENARTIIMDRVEKISWSSEIGVYAPLTRTGTVIVDGVVASCYATIDSQFIAHFVMAPIRMGYNLMEGFSRMWKIVSKPINGWSEERSIKLKEEPVGVYWYAQILYKIGNYVIPYRMYQ
nr:tiggy-winkle hedgehog protein [Onthophagus taurus]